MAAYLDNNWNLEVLVFAEGGKPENPEKNPRSKARTNNKLNPHETASTGIELGSQRWEASAYPLRHPCSPIRTPTSPRLLFFFSTWTYAPKSFLSGRGKTEFHLGRSSVQTPDNRLHVTKTYLHSSSVILDLSSHMKNLP